MTVQETIIQLREQFAGIDPKFNTVTKQIDELIKAYEFREISDSEAIELAKSIQTEYEVLKESSESVFKEQLVASMKIVAKLVSIVL